MKISQVRSNRLPVFPRAMAGIALALLLSACSDSNDSLFILPEQDTPPFQELVDQGVTRYLGAYSPSSTSQEGNIVNHQFGDGRWAVVPDRRALHHGHAG